MNDSPIITPKQPTMAELPPPCEVRTFQRGEAIMIQEFSEIALDAEKILSVSFKPRRYIGHGVASIKARTDQGLQEIPHQFSFPIPNVGNIVEAFAAYEQCRYDAFQLELTKLRRQAIGSGLRPDGR